MKKKFGIQKSILGLLHIRFILLNASLVPSENIGLPPFSAIFALATLAVLKKTTIVLNRRYHKINASITAPLPFEIIISRTKDIMLNNAPVMG